MVVGSYYQHFWSWCLYAFHNGSTFRSEPNLSLFQDKSFRCSVSSLFTFIFTIMSLYPCLSYLTLYNSSSINSHNHSICCLLIYLLYFCHCLLLSLHYLSPSVVTLLSSSMLFAFFLFFVIHLVFFVWFCFVFIVVIGYFSLGLLLLCSCYLLLVTLCVIDTLGALASFIYFVFLFCFLFSLSRISVFII